MHAAVVALAGLLVALVVAQPLGDGFDALDGMKPTSFEANHMLESAKGVVGMLATIQPPPADQCEVLDAIIKAIVLVDSAAEHNPSHIKGSLVSKVLRFQATADMSAACAETRQVVVGQANNGLAQPSDIADIVLMLREKMDQADPAKPKQSQRETAGLLEQPPQQAASGSLSQQQRQGRLPMKPLSVRQPATIAAPPPAVTGLLPTATAPPPAAADATATPEAQPRQSVWLVMLSWVDETAEIVLALFLFSLFVLTLGMVCPACSHMVVDLPHGRQIPSGSTTKRVVLGAQFDPHHINAQTGAVLHRVRAEDSSSLRPKPARPGLLRFLKGKKRAPEPSDREAPLTRRGSRQAMAPEPQAGLRQRK